MVITLIKVNYSYRQLIQTKMKYVRVPKFGNNVMLVALCMYLRV